ncbi:helix-turn-helix domain-containing protein [Candidatus Saccharibacteria bacterium]|nr:helix-turn-helix domain-containing protein [Candidatus Saccharibacteria bacterium]
MERYWPQEQVYLFAQLSLFPEKLAGEALGEEAFKRYVPASPRGDFDLMATLHQYERAGYFKFETTLSNQYTDRVRKLALMADRADLLGPAAMHAAAGHNGLSSEVALKVAATAPLTTAEVETLPNEAKRYLLFTLTDINRQKFTDELTAYLEKYSEDKLTTGRETRPENFASQQMKLWRAAVQDYPQHGYRPIIKSSVVPGATFWELILAHQLVTGDVWLVGMGYDDSVGSIAAGLSYRHAGTIAFAELEIKAKPVQQLVAAQARSVKPAIAALDDESEHEEYKGVAVDSDNRISYRGTPIPFTFQEQQVMFVFLDNPERLLTKDAFTNNPDVFTREHYPDKDATLRKLIWAVHTKLKRVIGKDCIENVPREGWRLEIK